jgi:hypothetical protein
MFFYITQQRRVVIVVAVVIIIISSSKMPLRCGAVVWGFNNIAFPHDITS